MAAGADVCRYIQHAYADVCIIYIYIYTHTHSGGMAAGGVTLRDSLRGGPLTPLLQVSLNYIYIYIYIKVMPPLRDWPLRSRCLRGGPLTPLLQVSLKYIYIYIYYIYIIYIYIYIY
jgi:hypothetical protein